MPIHHLSVPEEGMEFIRLQGAVGRSENMAALAKVTTKSAFSGSNRMLVDLRAFEATEMTSKDIHGMIHEIARVAGGPDKTIRVALCAAPGSFGFAMARIFHAYAGFEGLEVNAVVDTAEAVAWLGLQHDFEAYVDKLDRDGRLLVA